MAKANINSELQLIPNDDKGRKFLQPQRLKIRGI